MIDSINILFFVYQNILYRPILFSSMTLPIRQSVRKHVPVAHGGLSSIKNKIPDVIDFSSNVSPMGAPNSVKVALKNYLKYIENYPDLNSETLLRSLQRYIGLNKSHIIVGNGAIEILYNFCNIFLQKKDVLIPVPTFGEYEAASKLVDSNLRFFKTMNLSQDIESFAKNIPEKGCVFICNPNNPTGQLLSKKQIELIINVAKRKSSTVFVDECFIELVRNTNQSVVSLVKKYENLFVLRSLTKSFGLAGIRIGYAVTSKQMADILNKIKIPWSINALAQIAAIVALQNKKHLVKSKLIIKKEYDFLLSKLSSIDGIEFNNSSTNFILLKTKHDATDLQRELLKHKILVRNCKNFRGLDDHFIRIAIKSHKDNIKLIKALEATV